MVGNGFCNDETNNVNCNYDGGDCCVENAIINSCSKCSCHFIETCVAGYHPLVGNGFCDDDTNIVECEYDGGDCCGYNITSEHCTECTCFHRETCLAGVTHAFVGDGVCNEETNIAECDYDGLDCCSNPNMVGDGICNDETNHLGCNYDGGDCCSIVRISLTNEPLDPGYGYLNGDYEISIMPNGQTSWINGNYAIWYTSGHWHIGELADIGEQWAYIYATNDFHGLTDNENEWHYWDGSSWISLTDPSDVQITCEN